MIANVRRLISKEKKEQYARFKLEDLDGEIDCIVFPRAYAERLAKYLIPNTMVVVSGRINWREEKPELIVDEILSLPEAREKFVQRIWLKISPVALEDEFLEKLKNILQVYPGKCKIGFHVHTPTHEEIVLESGLGVSLKDTLIQELEKMLGSESLEFTA